MSVPYIGGSDVAILDDFRGSGRRLRFWAERGLLHCEDSRDNSYEVLSVRQFLHRVKGLNDMLGNSSDGHSGVVTRDEAARLRKFIDECVALAQKAREQGMPSDPSARREAARRKPVSVVSPGLKHQF